MDTRLDGIRRRIRLELQQGKVIAFVGWRDNFHDEFTRAIPPTKVLFSNSAAPGAHVGFIFFTKMINAKLRGKISRGRSVSHVGLEPSEVRTLLKECEGLILPQLTDSAASTTPADATNDVLDALTKPQELTAMQKFVKAFREEAAKNNGLVGRRVLGKIIREHETDGVIKLVAGDWIIPEIAKGKKRVGSYRAGEKMAELERKATILPDDPLERARFVLSQKDMLVAEKQKLESQLAAINAKLELIEKVSQAIGQIDNLLK